MHLPTLALLLAHCALAAASADVCLSRPAILPYGGFLLGTFSVDGQPTQRAFKIGAQTRIQLSCDTVEFANAPEFLGNESFARVGVANRKPYYDNGKYFLSFVTQHKTRPHGTWIVGNSPGVDSGIGYLKAPFAHEVPVFDNSIAESWQWINSDKKWEPHVDTSTRCLEASAHSVVYDAEYLRNEVVVRVKLRELAGSVELLSPESSAWVALAVAEDSVVPLGVPVHTSGDAESSASAECTLVNSEFLYSHWRLMLHCHSNVAERFLEYGDSGVGGGSLRAGGTGPVAASTLAACEEGAFVWLWFVPAQGMVRQTQNVLLQCERSADGVAVYSYFDENRRDIMTRGVLSYLADVVVANASLVTLDGEQVHVSSALPLGTDILGWMRAYLVRHEGRFGGLSSCFLYHSAIAMPQQLVYLAELVCVLIGSKPFTMIQFSSTGDDHQWKFPLTLRLARKIIAYASTDPTCLIGFEKFAYKSDETLVVFHKNSQHLIYQLLPYRNAQALHIAPYPDSKASIAENMPIYETQVYNSWWNGVVLGYPERFIEGYCKGMISELSAERKVEVTALARSDVAAHFRRIGSKPAVIGLGQNPEIDRRFWDFLSRR